VIAAVLVFRAECVVTERDGELTVLARDHDVEADEVVSSGDATATEPVVVR
jgi:hypothetical protein